MNVLPGAIGWAAMTKKRVGAAITAAFTAAGTVLASLDLGELVQNDLVIVSLQIQATKGGTGGDVAVRLTFTNNNRIDLAATLGFLEARQAAIAAGVVWSEGRTFVARCITTGPQTLTLTGISAGSDTGVSAGSVLGYVIRGS
jgi:hypothetical protein